MGIRIKYRMELLTPAITAETGTIGKEIDLEVKRDVNGNSYYSAKHIKGVFRTKVLEFRSALYGKEEAEKFVKKYFGDEGNNPSKIRFSNLEIEKKDDGNVIGSRYGVKINRKTRVAEDNSLFSYEFVKPENIYRGELEINESSFDLTKEEDKEALKFLLASFLHVDKIGGLKSRGLGRVKISFEKTEEEKIEDIKEILELFEKNKEKSQQIKELGELKEYNYELEFSEPVVLQGKVNKNEVELRHSLQASTIRGAIIQYGLDNNFKIEDLLKIEINEVKKYVNEKEEIKLASSFETKYPIKDDIKEKVDKAISTKKECRKNEDDENGIKLERDSLALLKATGTELSIKIDEKTRTTKESFLFSTEYVQLKEYKKEKEMSEENKKISFGGDIKIPEGLFEAGKEYNLRIGKYKTKGFGNVKISFKDGFKEEKIKNLESRIEIFNEEIKKDFMRIEKENEKKKAKNKEDEMEKIYEGDEKLKSGEQKLITLDFLSDMILPFNQVKNAGEEILTLLGGLENKLTLNRRRTFVNVEKLRGYNIVNQMRKMDEIVITQGSVVSYCVDKNENILKELEEIEKNGIGLRRNEGFGRIRICSER